MAVERQAAAIPVVVEWHDGRRLSVESLAEHPLFRGAHVVEVGRPVARDGVLDAASIGEAALRGAEDAQDLTKVWHHVARFGVPTESI